MYEHVEKSSNFTFTKQIKLNQYTSEKKRPKTKSHELFAFWLCSVCSAGQQMCFIVRSSEGLVLSLGVMQVVLMVRVVKVVGLVTMVAVADDGVLDAFTLQVLLLVDALQLSQQLLDESLRRSAACLFLFVFTSVSQVSFKFVCVSARVCLCVCPLRDISRMFYSDLFL